MFKLEKKKKCKVLFISPDLGSGGAENILFNVVKNIDKKEVVLISLTDIGFYGQKLIKEGYQIYAINMKKNLTLIIKIWKLFFLMVKLKPIIVHTWLYHANFIGGSLAKLLNIKKIYWSIHHDFEYSSFFKMIEMKLLIILSYFVPNKIIYCSNISKINHIKNGYSKNYSEIIENGISTSQYKPNKLYRNQIRRKLKISEDCFVVGNISRYHYLKDHDNLLKALYIFNRNNLNFKCILVGNGLSNNNSDLIKKINKYSLSNKIILFGQSFEVNKIINCFDLNILSSIKECSPIVLMESMSSGVPCLSTDVGDAKKIIGETGWVVDPSDPLSFGKTLYKIATNRNILQEKSQKVRKRIIQKYAIEKMIEDYKILYL